MQITLVQSEIEQALKDYINGQVNVKEGMEIVIDFKATRGAEGNTAIIDIRPAAEATAIVPSKAEPKPQRVQPTKVAQSSEDPPFTPDTNKPETGSDTGASESTAGAAAVAQSAETASAEATPAAPKKSLFGNLGKPAE